MNDLSMPSLELTSSQHSFQHHRISFGSQKLYHSNDRELSFLWRSFKISMKQRAFSVSHLKMQCDRVLINAVATLEPKILTENNAHDAHRRLRIHIDSEALQRAEHQSSSDDELDDREKLRRKRISKANKGKSPWNKGRKHTAETRQRIREKTRLAMQDPKVRMKLINLGHSQSSSSERLAISSSSAPSSGSKRSPPSLHDPTVLIGGDVSAVYNLGKETRVKIGVGVRIGWNKRREKLMLQETCHVDWQNLIAETSRSGLAGEEELQWDSYKILDEQLEQEWLESVEQRKRVPRPKGSKRAPKSAEQKRKISEAIAAKWADPAYRDRVYTGLSKYHGTPIGADNPRRRQKRTSTSISKKNNVTDNPAGNTRKSSTQQTRMKRYDAPIYKDPLASSKLQMIKNIRADRENKKAEAMTRAKLLIAEAENAAKALELAAAKSPLAQSSLIETRKLIAEAIQSIESIEGGFDENERDSPSSLNNVEEIDLKSEGLVTKDQIEVNGSRALLSNFDDISDSAFEKFNLQQLLNQEDEILPSSSYDVDFINDTDYLKGLLDNGTDLSRLEPLDKPSSFTHQLDHLAPNGSSVKHGDLVPNGAKSELWELGTSPKSIKSSKEKPPKSTNTVKKWVRGKLVEVTEEG